MVSSKYVFPYFTANEGERGPEGYTIAALYSHPAGQNIPYF